MCVWVWGPMHVWGQMLLESTKGCQILVLELQAVVSCPEGVGTKIGSCAKTTKVSSSPKTLRLCLAILDYLFINRLPRPGWSWIPCIAKDDLEPLILIPLPPACWDHRQVSAELGLYPLSHLLSHVKGSFFFFCVWLRVGSSNTR